MSKTALNALFRRLYTALGYGIRVAFVVLTDTYGIVITLLLVMKGLAGESWWPVGLLNSLIPVILLPAIIMLPGSLLLRRWRLAAGVILPLLFLGFNYGGLYLPQTVHAGEDLPTLTILTFNTHSETEHFQAMIDLILEAGPDIIALQEYTQPAADYFAEHLAERYPYQALHPVGISVLGKGFFSRYPIMSDDISDESEPRFQRLTIDMDGQTVTIYNAHPSVPQWTPPFDSSKRGQNIRDLLEHAAGTSGPLLLMGDFNMTDQSDDYQRVASQYKDTYREVGWGLGPTFPDYTTFNTGLAIVPQFLRLDYVFHNDDFRPLSAQVWPTSGGSDHHPLFVKLTLAKMYE